MSTTTPLPPTLKLNINLTDDQYFELCQNNRDLRFERTATGELIIMSPTDSDTGNCNFDIAVEIGIWNKQTKLGKGFDSSTGFKLPNGTGCKNI
jgi:Uma2 family endonuclease